MENNFTETPLERLIRYLKLHKVDEEFYLIGRASIHENFLEMLKNYEIEYLKHYEITNTKQ